MTRARPGMGVRRRLGSLQTRLLFWFLGAMALAVGASALMTVLTATDNAELPSRVVSRHVQARVAKVWDDPVATDAYVLQLRETTGLDIRVRRSTDMFQGRLRRERGVVLDDGVAYVPVLRKGDPIGALEIRTGAPAPSGWRIVVALLAAVVVLGAVARRVSIRLARPIEHVAATAEQFGLGNLAARTGVDQLPRRWVAEEVRDLGRAFDGMAERIGRVVTEQRELLAAISHELRSPLGRARVALEIARERSEAVDGAQKPLDDVELQLVEMDAILGDLLASARAGLADLRREPVIIATWLDQKLAGETTGPVEVVVRLGPEIEVSIDPALLGRALHNLLANAWAHGHPKEVALEVSATATPERIRISVRDHGPGFAADILPRAFEPFVTGTGAARSPGQHGIGLGLALVRRIVEAHGGTVQAENIGDGAIVAFDLPRQLAPSTRDR